MGAQKCWQVHVASAPPLFVLACPCLSATRLSKCACRFTLFLWFTLIWYVLHCWQLCCHIWANDHLSFAAGLCLSKGVQGVGFCQLGSSSCYAGSLLQSQAVGLPLAVLSCCVALAAGGAFSAFLL